MKGVELVYQYRDGGNFKHLQGVDLVGTASSKAEGALLGACYRDYFFVPEQVGLPMAAPWCRDWTEYRDDLDDVWHELVELREVSRLTASQFQGSLGETIDKFQKANQEGWNDPEPMEWYGSQRRTVIFEEAVEQERFHVLGHLLEAHQKPNLPKQPAEVLYQHYRDQNRLGRAAQLLELSPGLAQSLEVQELMWLLQAPDPEIRRRTIRASGASQRPRKPNQKGGTRR